MPHAFDEVIATAALDPYLFAARTSPAYGGFANPFGGATAATVLSALQSHPETQGQPLALTINFLAPLADGEWTVALELLKTNRINQHWSFTAHQNEGVAFSGTAVFGLARDTWGDSEAIPPSAPAPTATPQVEFPELVVWAQNYETRFVTGWLDSPTPAEDSTSTFWIRDRPPRALDYPALTSLADSFVPRVFLRRASFMAAGTISLSVYYHATPQELSAQGEAHVLATARVGRFGHGHFDQHGQLFSASGALLATTLLQRPEINRPTLRNRYKLFTRLC